MKILLYNWMNYDDAQKRGGGVRLYQENLVAELQKIPGIIVYTLSSGINYDLFGRRVRIIKRHVAEQVRSYEVVNSPIVAPAHAASDSLDIFLDDKSLQSVIREFLHTHGPFDVVQFDNLEGLTAGVLELKDHFPETRFIYYLHNYNAFCPQVNLWFSERVSCDNYNEGIRCSFCIPDPASSSEVRMAHAISNFLRSIGISPDSFTFRMVYRQLAFSRRIHRRLRSALGRFRRLANRVSRSFVTPRPTTISNDLIYTTAKKGVIYKQYRTINVSNLNTKFDHVLAVSNRVRELAIEFGIHEDKVSVAYIGSRFADKMKSIRVRESRQLKIAYLGYEKSDKGFYHFVETLEAMPRSTAQRISVLIAVKLQSADTLHRLKRASLEFGSFEIVDGYDHDSLGKLLEDVDLGIIPVLWEDALPQVAIEFVTHGVPVLCSDLGGTKELSGSNSIFVYRHGNTRELIGRLEYFIRNRAALARYSDFALTISGMEQHVRMLLRRYYSSSPERYEEGKNLPDLMSEKVE